MSYIWATVIVVLFYLLTPMSGEPLFKCPGENVTLVFEKIDFHEGTVTWYKNLTDENTEFIASKAGDKDPIVSAPFYHYAEIDRDLNLILRNVSSESSGEYFRRIVNGGIFNSIVNLYVMCAPSGKPIVTIERNDNGTDFVQYGLPLDLGNPKANLAIKLLETLFTENGSNSIMQQYEICLIGKSIKCFEGSPCQNYTIQSTSVERLKHSTEDRDRDRDRDIRFLFVPSAIFSLISSTLLIYILDDESWVKKSWFGHLKTIITQRRTIFGSAVVLGILSTVITIVLWLYYDSELSLFFPLLVSVSSYPILGITASVKKAKNRKLSESVLFSFDVITAMVWQLCMFIFMGLTATMWFLLNLYLDWKLSLSLSSGVPILIHLGLIVIFIQRLKKKKYRHRVTRPKTGNSKESQSLLQKLKTDNAEKQNCEVDNGETDTEMNQMCVGKTDQNDDVRPGSSNSV